MTRECVKERESLTQSVQLEGAQIGFTHRRIVASTRHRLVADHAETEEEKHLLRSETETNYLLTNKKL